MSTQNARDTHFFLAGWNGHLENHNATTHFQQAMKSAPTPTAPLVAEPTTRSDAETLARAETTARFLLGWKYGQMPASADTLLRQSARVKAQWAWNAACKLLRFIDGSAPAEVPAATSEPMGPAAPAAQAVEPAAVAPGQRVTVNAGALQMVVNALRRDAVEGKAARGEMADELLATVAPAPAAVAVPAMQWRAIKDGMPAWTDDNSIRVIAITAEDDFSGAQVHDVAAADFHIRDPEGPTDPDSVGTEVTRACTHWAYRDEIWPRAALAATPPAQAGAAEPAPITFMTVDQACKWGWEDVRKEVGTEGWTVMDSVNYHGFFLWGWNYRGQYELQRAATRSAFMQELTAAPAASAPQAQNVQRDTQRLDYLQQRSATVDLLVRGSGFDFRIGGLACSINGDIRKAIDAAIAASAAQKGGA